MDATRGRRAAASIEKVLGFASSSSSRAPDESDDSYAERLLVSQLEQAKDGSPFLFLLQAYASCVDEFRRVQAMSPPAPSAKRTADASLVEQQETNLFNLKLLIVSYSGLCIRLGMFPQDPKLEQRGVLQLLDALLQNKVPPGFMHDFAKRFDGDGLDDVVVPIVAELGKVIVNVSPLGDFATPLNIVKALLAIKQIGLAVARSEAFLPVSRLANGRSVEYDTLLGPFFKVSTLPDIFGNGSPAIRSNFSNLESRQNSEVAKMVQILRDSIVDAQNHLHEIVKGLLGKDTRECMLSWIATAVQSNAGRSKMRIDPLKCATHGFFLNLSSVMLYLCMPFMGPYESKAWERIDIGYAYFDGRLRLTDETRCAASLEEVGAYEEAHAKALAKGKYHFICECFFITAKVLHLGLLKSVREFLENMRELSRHQHRLRGLEASQASWANGPYRGQTMQQINQLKAWINEHKEIHLCYECAIQEERVLKQALAFYRLLGGWLLRLATGGGEGGSGSAGAGGAGGSGGGAGDVRVTLTEEFKMLPEFYVDDVVQLLVFVSKLAERQPRVIMDEDLDGFMSFLVIFMGCPQHINNPYLRAHMVDVLHHWVPPPNATHPLAHKFANIFEYHPIGNKLLVDHLLRLYVDIEFTGGHNQFYDKFNIRHQIGEMLQYLWEIPVHRDNWKAFAEKEAEGFYLKFVNMLVNDAIYLLDEGMKKLPEVRQTLEAMANVEAWNAVPPQEQAERESALRTNEDILRNDLILAMVHIEIMQYTTKEITKAFLLPEMVERIATMLNYFLRFLVGPERKNLKVKNPDKYGWNPHKMLSQIMKIYINLAAADGKGDFATSIARDGRSYSHELFVEAHTIAERHMLTSPEELSFFDGFVAKVQSQVALDAKEDEILGEIPDEFLDPIQYTLMQDPVMLPSSKVVVDRATIQRHLLSDQTDPFNRAELSAEMLVPQDDLKQKIKTWLKDQRAKT